MTGEQKSKRLKMGNFLLLKPIQRICHFDYLTLCSFQVQRENIEEKKPKGKGKGITVEFPVYNRDGNFTTPSFILSSEKNKLVQDSRNVELDQNIFANEDLEKSEMLLAKPRGKNNHCTVCKMEYIDYLNHIYSIPHKEKIKRSKFNDEIQSLIQMFKKNRAEIVQNLCDQENQFGSQNLRNLPSKKQKLSISTESIKQNFQNSSNQNIINIAINSLQKPQASDLLFQQQLSRTHQSRFITNFDVITQKLDSFTPLLNSQIQ